MSGRENQGVSRKWNQGQSRLAKQGVSLKCSCQRVSQHKGITTGPTGKGCGIFASVCECLFVKQRERERGGGTLYVCECVCVCV